MAARISILQHNTNKSSIIMQSCLEIAIESCIDFILIQEPWIVFDNNILISISHPAYYYILPNSYNNIRPRVAIYARKHLNYQFCHKTNLTNNTNIIIIDISGSDINTFQIINIYNEKSLDESNSSYIIKRSLQNL